MTDLAPSVVWIIIVLVKVMTAPFYFTVLFSTSVPIKYTRTHARAYAHTHTHTLTSQFQFPCLNTQWHPGHTSVLGSYKAPSLGNEG